MELLIPTDADTSPTNYPSQVLPVEKRDIASSPTTGYHTVSVYGLDPFAIYGIYGNLIDPSFLKAKPSQGCIPGNEKLWVYNTLSGESLEIVARTVKDCSEKYSPRVFSTSPWSFDASTKGTLEIVAQVQNWWEKGSPTVSGAAVSTQMVSNESEREFEFVFRSAREI